MRAKEQAIPDRRDRRDVPNTEPLSGGDDTQAGHSRDIPDEVIQNQ